MKKKGKGLGIKTNYLCSSPQKTHTLNLFSFLNSFRSKNKERRESARKNKKENTAPKSFLIQTILKNMKMLNNKFLNELNIRAHTTHTHKFFYPEIKKELIEFTVLFFLHDLVFLTYIIHTWHICTGSSDK